jgi:hypothetical protein
MGEGESMPGIRAIVSAWCTLIFAVQLEAAAAMW